MFTIKPAPANGQESHEAVKRGGSRGRRARLSLATVAAVLVGCAMPAAALAGAPFDSGVSPSVAEGPYGDLVQVHQGGVGAGPLWFSIGTQNYAYPAPQSVQWGPSSQYSNGMLPSVASGYSTQNTNPGFLNRNPIAVEVHQNGAGAGPLSYQTGLWNNGTIRWYGSQEYVSYGATPSVAVNDTGTVVEVHQGGAGAGPLWYDVGTLLPNGYLSWGQGHQYDNGAAPSVALDGNTAIEVHQGGSGPGEMWYRVGTVSPATQTITWGNSHPYQYGMSPSVSVDSAGVQIKEVHQGGAGFGALWTVAGTLAANDTINWGNGWQYDNGVSPHIAQYVGCGQPDDYTEVHQGAVGFSTLWYDTYLTGCTPLPAQ